MKNTHKTWKVCLYDLTPECGPSDEKSQVSTCQQNNFSFSRYRPNVNWIRFSIKIKQTLQCSNNVPTEITLSKFSVIVDEVENTKWTIFTTELMFNAHSDWIHIGNFWILILMQVKLTYFATIDVFDSSFPEEKVDKIALGNWTNKVWSWKF